MINEKNQKTDDKGPSGSAPDDQALVTARLADYQRIALALEFIIEHSSTQPALVDVAEHVGLSEFHFQRLFRRWAGISPKRFVQYLTARHTQGLIREAPSLLDASLEAGLSGPGRLHDLYVSVLGMTPAEARDGGSGLTLTWSLQPTPFGLALLASTSRGLSNLEFINEEDAASAEALLGERWPGALLQRNDEALAPMAGRIFSGLAAEPDGGLILHVRGTNFQIRVWEALLNLPAGARVSYEGLANHIEMPGAARAVASAVARNPVGYLIPCHRVIRASGAIGDYRWGSVRKHAILGWESALSGR